MAQIQTWTPEDATFWERTGKKIANRNLWISVFCLLCAFAVWMFWSIIIVQMQNLGFPFTKMQLYTLPAIAGLAGATLRIPNSFLIALSGGRNVIAITTGLLLIPAIMAGIALQDINTPYAVFAVAAALSGIGGGNFASSMSNISTFFPKRMQGTALGVNAGIGNLGVSVMQLLLPIVSTFALFGSLSGAGRALPKDVAGKVAGTLVWVQNDGLMWVPVLAVLAIAAWFLMNNLPQHKIGSTPAAIGKTMWLLILSYVATGLGMYLLLTLGWNMWIVLPLTIVVTLGLMRYLTPAALRTNLSGQFVIFRKKHNWIMTILYIMTFGSFIGYSSAFPKLIQDVFGTLPGGVPNPHGPNALNYAWLGALVGSLVRPIGGWLSDKIGGAKVTQWSTVVMIGAAAGVAYYIKAATGSQTPEEYFTPFLLLFMLLFITTGLGNGSTFRMIPVIFEPTLAGPVLGWTSAIAAYGSFVIPKVFGAQIEAGHAENALYGFIVYYVVSLGLNWWYYARKNAEIAC